MKFLKNCHFLDGNNLFSPNQSGFRPSDFSEYQLISIVHHIYASFDCCHCCPSLEVTQKDFLGLCNTFKSFIQQSANVLPKRFNVALHLQGYYLKSPERFCSILLGDNGILKYSFRITVFSCLISCSVNLKPLK